MKLPIWLEPLNTPTASLPLHNEYSGYNTKPSDGEAPVLEL